MCLFISQLDKAKAPTSAMLEGGFGDGKNTEQRDFRRRLATNVTTRRTGRTAQTAVTSSKVLDISPEIHKRHSASVLLGTRLCCQLKLETRHREDTLQPAHSHPELPVCGTEDMATAGSLLHVSRLPCELKSRGLHS